MNGARRATGDGRGDRCRCRCGVVRPLRGRWSCCCACGCACAKRLSRTSRGTCPVSVCPPHCFLSFLFVATHGRRPTRDVFSSFWFVPFGEMLLSLSVSLGSRLDRLACGYVHLPLCCSVFSAFNASLLSMSSFCFQSLRRGSGESESGLAAPSCFQNPEFQQGLAVCFINCVFCPKLYVSVFTSGGVRSPCAVVSGRND